MLTIGEPIGAIEVKVLTSQTQCTSSVECDTWPTSFAPDKNIGDMFWLFVHVSLFEGGWVNWAVCSNHSRDLFVLIFSEVSREISQGPKCTSQILKCAVIGLRFFPLVSAVVYSGTGTRAEPLTTSAREANISPPSHPTKSFFFTRSACHSELSILFVFILK